MTFLDKLKKKILDEFKPEEILLIDNSKLHSKHKFFDSNKFHLKLTIKSQKLASLNKIDAHKKIYSFLKEEMKEKIHALEIEIT
mgnify:FL=1